MNVIDTLASAEPQSGISFNEFIARQTARAAGNNGHDLDDLNVLLADPVDGDDIPPPPPHEYSPPQRKPPVEVDDDGFVVGFDDPVLLGELATTAELFSRAKPPNFLVRNVLTAGTLAVWAAPEKAWKTTLGVHLALVVTGHGKFLNQYESVSTGPVIFFSGESGDWPLKSMMERILDWNYPAALSRWDGEVESMIPLPDDIPIVWGNDPPDLGDERSIPALRRAILKHGAKLMILDPSQALFGSISEDVKNDFSMRQYLKLLQLLACCAGWMSWA